MADQQLTDSRKIKYSQNRDQHTFKKRIPPRFPKRENDIYISNKSNFKSQFEKCEKLLDGNNNEILLHGLGAAIDRTINLALRLKEKFMDTCEIDVNTSTVSLQDDFEPTDDHVDYETQIRQNSAIHIRIYRINLPTESSSSTQQ